MAPGGAWVWIWSADLWKGKEHQEEKIQVNHPITVNGWKIYQTSYDEKLGRWSETSIVELVLDPWLPMVYAGILY